MLCSVTKLLLTRGTVLITCASKDVTCHMQVVEFFVCLTILDNQSMILQLFAT